MNSTETEKKPLTFDMRLRVYHEDHAFGNGVAQLLALIKEKGSIKGACEEMEMATSKAWKILKRAEKDFGFPLLVSKSGGKSGGSTTLSPEGEDLLNRYNAFRNEIRQFAQKSFEKHFGECK